MSEQAPRSNSRLDNFEANKAAHEKAQYEDALYGEAGVTDFSDEAKKRVEEADTYERHLESLAGRADTDDIMDSLKNPDVRHEDAIDRQIAADPSLRRMEAMAQSIASAYATEVTPENADRLPTVIKDKEDKLQELMIAFNDTSDIDPADKDEIIRRIIDMSEQSGASEVASSVENPEGEPEASADSDPNQATANESESGAVPEGAPALEGESQEEYEARNGGVNPDLAIDPNEMPIAVPEMPGDNPEQEQQIEFTVGDTVRVRRTSGEIEDDWTVLAVSGEGDERTVMVGKNEVGTKRVAWQELVDMQAVDAEQPESDSTEDVESDDVVGSEITSETEDSPDGPEAEVQGRARSWFNRAKDVVNGGLTKLYFGIGRTMNKLASNERKDGETDEEYNERMKRNGRRAAVGIAAVAAAYGAYRLYHGIDGASGGGSGGSNIESPFDPSVDPGDLGPDTSNGPDTTAHAELLNSDAWNIPKGSGGESLMDRIGADKSVWYQHQDEFLNRFPSEAYRMADGNVGFDDPGRLSKEAIDFWAQYATK